MRVEVMDYYGFTKPLNRAGYYETEHHRLLFKSIRSSILEGRIIVLYGVIGSGKTLTLRRLQQQLQDENKITISKSQTIEKNNIKLGTLMTALFYDLSPGKKVRIPGRTEDRDRVLLEIIKKGNGQLFCL